MESRKRGLEETKDGSEEVGIPSYRRNTMIFSDPAIGNQIELNEACVKIIKTPEFNRLHDIHQTGPTYLVYPAAKHSRFEHSLGTCYLAGKVMKRLRKMQPELGITDRDILSVEIAALCHDLGHGPFSHTFDQMFLPLARPGFKLEHEEVSIEMFYYLLKQNPDVKRYLDTILQPEDFKFIEEAITSVKETDDPSAWPYEGRPFDKAFMYDIVSNKMNGLDVDKMDYFRRDSHSMSVPTNANIDRVYKNMRVMAIEPHKRKTICYPEKVEIDLTNLARTRAQLHTVAYQHRTVKRIEAMLVDAMLIADKEIKAPGANGKMYCLSESVNDMSAYVKFKDAKVLSDIECSTSEALKGAREILERIGKRQLYAKIGEADSGCRQMNDQLGSGLCAETAADIAAYLSEYKEEFPDIDDDRLKKSLVVMIADIHGGMKNENPIRNVWFFKKGQPKPFRLSEKKLKRSAPPIRRKVIHVFCREEDQVLISAAEKCFIKWRRANNLNDSSKVSSDDSDESGNYSSQPGSDVEG